MNRSLGHNVIMHIGVSLSPSLGLALFWGFNMSPRIIILLLNAYRQVGTCLCCSEYAPVGHMLFYIINGTATNKDCFHRIILKCIY